MAAAAANWRTTGEGLGLETAKAVAAEHKVPLDVVVKGSFADAVDGQEGFLDLHRAEDDFVVHNQATGKDFIKLSKFEKFREACRVGQGQRQPGAQLMVVVMPYADLTSCNLLRNLDLAAPHYGYAKIYIANLDMLLWKRRDYSALKDELAKCRGLSTHLEMAVRVRFPQNKVTQPDADDRQIAKERLMKAHPDADDRQIAKERLMKAHLDAMEYGDAHELLILSDNAKHDAIFQAAGCYDPCSNSSGDQTQQKQQTALGLVQYKATLDEHFGNSQLHPFPERADILKLEAQSEFRRKLTDARRRIQDAIDKAREEVQLIANDLQDVMDAPTLVGCGV